jgi:hypothetical protein
MENKTSQREVQLKAENDYLEKINLEIMEQERQKKENAQHLKNQFISYND